MKESRIPILFYYTYYYQMTGGPATFVELIRLLDKQRFQPVLVTSEETEFTERIRQVGGETVVIPVPASLNARNEAALRAGLLTKLRFAWSVIQYNFKMRKVIRQYKFRLAWVRQARSMMLCGFAIRRAGIPLIWDIAVEKESKGIVRLLHGISLWLADIVITEARCQHEGIFGPERASKYANKLTWIDSAIGQEKIDRILRLIAAEPHVPQNQRVRLLSVGLVCERKNQKMLVEAFSHLHGRFPNLSLDIAGPAEKGQEWYFSEVEQMIEEKGLGKSIVMHGWTDQVPEMMAKSDLFVMTTRNEGVPHVIKEAMYAKLPVVATAVGGIPDVVFDGETGYVVPSEDLDGFVERVADIVASAETRKRMGEAAQAKANELFSPQKELEAYEKLFAEMSL